MAIPKELMLTEEEISFIIDRLEDLKEAGTPEVQQAWLKNKRDEVLKRPEMLALKQVMLGVVGEDKYNELIDEATTRAFENIRSQVKNINGIQTKLHLMRNESIQN